MARDCATGLTPHLCGAVQDIVISGTARSIGVNTTESNEGRELVANHIRTGHERRAHHNNSDAPQPSAAESLSVQTDAQPAVLSARSTHGGSETPRDDTAPPASGRTTPIEFYTSHLVLSDKDKAAARGGVRPRAPAPLPTSACACARVGLEPGHCRVAGGVPTRAGRSVAAAGSGVEGSAGIDRAARATTRAWRALRLRAVIHRGHVQAAIPKPRWHPRRPEPRTTATLLWCACSVNAWYPVHRGADAAVL